MSFPKIVSQKGSFGQLRNNSFFRFCRPILDIFGFTLLNSYGGGTPENTPFFQNFFMAKI